MKQLKLCLVTNIGNKPFQEYLNFIEQAVAGGVTMVQLREKFIPYSEIKKRALALQDILRTFNVPLIINDYVDLAIEIDADGVHVGNSDMSALKAREKLGLSKIIGVSIENMEDLEDANKLPVSYVAASAIFPSSTKLDCKTFWGIDGLKIVVEKSTHPVIAIGGIGPQHIAEIFNTGAKGVAVVGAIHEASDPYRAARSLLI